MREPRERRGAIDLRAPRRLTSANPYSELRIAVRALITATGSRDQDASAGLATLADRLCEDGDLSRSEAAFHARACAAAMRREDDLRRRLERVLDILADEEAASPVAGGHGGTDIAAHCFGPFQVSVGGAPVGSWGGSKPQALLRYLLLNRRARVPKEVLMDLLWPDATLPAARRNLHQAVYALRSALRRGHGGAQYVCFADDCYFIDPTLSVWIDREAFEAGVERGDRLEREGRAPEALAEYAAAERLYRGDLLAEHPYDAWVIDERERLRSVRQRIACRLCDGHIERGELDQATALCQKLLAADPCDEDAHRRLMECHLAAGRAGLAARQYARCQRALSDGLGVSPSTETDRLAARCGPLERDLSPV